MPERTSKQSAGVGIKHLAMVLVMHFRRESIRLVCVLQSRIGAHYAAGAYTSTKAEVQSVGKLAPQVAGVAPLKYERKMQK